MLDADDSERMTCGPNHSAYLIVLTLHLPVPSTIIAFQGPTATRLLTSGSDTQPTYLVDQLILTYAPALFIARASQRRLC